MAIHNDRRSMAIEVIDEYLAIAKHCVETEKPSGGLFGYPAVLLLFSVVDALSNYCGYRPDSFQILGEFDKSLKRAHVVNLVRWYRNPLAHVAITIPMTNLSPEPTGGPFTFNPDDEPTQVRVIPFYNLIKVGWDNFDRSRVNPEFRPEKAPKNPLDPSESLDSMSSSAKA